jgi:hypothetical protein
MPVHISTASPKRTAAFKPPDPFEFLLSPYVRKNMRFDLRIT